jgi:hypothetical protein
MAVRTLTAARGSPIAHPHPRPRRSGSLHFRSVISSIGSEKRYTFLRRWLRGFLRVLFPSLNFGAENE